MRTPTTQQIQLWNYALLALFFTNCTMLPTYIKIRWEARWEAQLTSNSIEWEDSDTDQTKAQPAKALEMREPP